MTTTPARVDTRPELATVALETLRYLGLDPAAIPTRALVAVSQRYRLDPLVGEVQLIQTKNGPRVYISRDGMVALAHRTGELDGIVVDEERRNSRDDGWTCYVSVYRKGCRYPFRYGAQCKDTEDQAKRGNGPEMALARAERRALKRAFAVGAAAFDPDDEPDDDYHAGAGPNVQGSTAPADAQTVDTEPAPAPKRQRTKRKPAAERAVEPAELVPALHDAALADASAGGSVHAPGALAEWRDAVPPAQPASAGTVDAVYRPELVPDPEPPPARIPPAGDLSGRLQGAAHRTVASWPAEKRDAFLAAYGVDDFGSAWPADVVDAALEEPF